MSPTHWTVHSTPPLGNAEWKPDPVLYPEQLAVVGDYVRIDYDGSTEDFTVAVVTQRDEGGFTYELAPVDVYGPGGSLDSDPAPQPPGV